jgi:hypothetical protein
MPVPMPVPTTTSIATKNHHPILPIVLIVEWLDSIPRKNVLVVPNFYFTSGLIRPVRENAKKLFVKTVAVILVWQRIAIIIRNTAQVVSKDILVGGVIKNSTRNAYHHLNVLNAEKLVATIVLTMETRKYWTKLNNQTVVVDRSSCFSFSKMNLTLFPQYISFLIFSQTYSCYVCDHLFCLDCKDVTICRKCENIFCDGCKESFFCFSCEEWLCSDCDTGIHVSAG